jgi:hypothetical protein
LASENSMKTEWTVSRVSDAVVEALHVNTSTHTHKDVCINEELLILSLGWFIA